MKRFFISVLAILLFSGSLHALGFGYGLRGGLNLSSVPSADSFQAGEHRFTALSDSYTGFHIGVMGQMVFTGFYLQPELLYTRTGMEMRRETTGETAQDDVFFTQRYDHLVLPVTMGAKFGPLRIGAGPVFSLLLDDSSDFTGTQQLRQEMNNVTMGIQAGIGLDLAALVLDFKYETSLTRFGDQMVIDGQQISFDTRPRQFILSIGFLF